jgi:hypothetical protein
MRLTNANKIIQEVRKLDEIDRLNVITNIWDEIKESQELNSVSDETKQLLLNRLTTYRRIIYKKQG